MGSLVFCHLDEWGNKSHPTWCPVDSKGLVIPHIYGYICNSDDRVSDTVLENWEKFDAYLLEESVKNSIGLFGNTEYFVPTGNLSKIESRAATSVSYTSIYCDSGCYGCGYEYPHTEWQHKSTSGVLLVPAGSSIHGLLEMPRGNSYYPKHFKLSYYETD